MNELIRFHGKIESTEIWADLPSQKYTRGGLMAIILLFYMDFRKRRRPSLFPYLQE